MKPSLHFYIDVSGQPTGTVFVGLLSIQSYEINSVIKAVKKKYLLEMQT